LFCEQETIQYCIKQLRSSKFKNLKPQEKLSSTQKSYAYILWRFNKWLQGRNFEFSQLNLVTNDSFKQIKDELVQMQQDGIIPNMDYEDKDPIYFNNLWNRWKRKNKTE